MEEQKKLFLTNLIVAILIISAIIGVALAVTYVLTPSTPQTATWGSGTVNVPVALTLNATSLSDLDKLELTASTSTNGNGLTCSFYDGATKLGQTLIVDGSAKLVVGAPAALGAHSYTAGP